MPSIAARMIEAGLRLLGPKRMMNDPERFSRTFGAAGKPGEPSHRLRRRLSVAERRVQTYRVFDVGSSEAKGQGRILYIHGSADVQELAAIHWRMVDNLVSRTRAEATVPVYPLAPAAGWQNMSALMVSLYREMVSAVGAEHVSTVGDSSGAGLALSVTMALRDVLGRIFERPRRDRSFLSSR